MYCNVSYTFIPNSTSQYMIIFYFIVLSYYTFIAFFLSCIHHVLSLHVFIWKLCFHLFLFQCCIYVCYEPIKTFYLLTYLLRMINLLLEAMQRLLCPIPSLYSAVGLKLDLLRRAKIASSDNERNVFCGKTGSIKP